MKRWWYTPGDCAWVRKTVRRVRPILTPAAMAGALCFPISSQTLERIITPPRTTGAVIQAWAFGTLSDAKQPKSQAACDLAHVCELAISSAGGAGTGAGATIKNSLETSPQVELPPNLPFTLTETIDYPHPVTKGVPGNTGQGACYPASGVMTITIATNPSWTLVLDMVGQLCQVGSSSARLVFTGSYVADAASTGPYPDGIGSANINNPSGLSGAGTYTSAADTTYMKASLVGQLKFFP